MHPASACLTVSALIGAALTAGAAQGSEVLHNGIVLPDEWPPKTAELTRDPPATPPYLVSPPEVIRIDVGRQLFVDDFLVDSTTLERTYHLPKYHSTNPVIRPDKETDGMGWKSRRVGAGVFSDGVWYDPADRLFKCWYWGGATRHKTLGYYTCYATSRDGIHWDKPALDVVPGTNVVLQDEEGLRRNSSTVWLDLDEGDPARRFKMFRVVIRETRRADGPVSLDKWMRLHFSPDGVHWTLAGESDRCGDRSTVFYNPFRKVWVYGVRDGSREVSRCRAYCETAEPLKVARWGHTKTHRKNWVGADRLDPDRSDLDLRRVPERPWDLVPSQLYNLDCVGYESVMLGLFSIWRGHPKRGRPKINEVCVGFSRDGFHWSRPDRRAFCPVSETKEAWNFGNVQSAGGGCLVVGDKLYFYVTAANRTLRATGLDATYTGLAVLRRDGFASMDADNREGTLTTRKVQFTGRHCFVNVAAAAGELRVEVLDADGNVIPPFTKANCLPVTTDSTIQRVQWRGGQDLSALSGKPVRLRFHLRNGQLYAFWVTPDASGASHGYVAAGGPGFTGNRDTVGQAAYEAAD